MVVLRLSSRKIGECDSLITVNHVTLLAHNETLALHELSLTVFFTIETNTSS